MDNPIFKDGYYIYPDGSKIPETDAIEGLSTMHDESKDDPREETTIKDKDEI